jgi:hypothetical protein
MRLARLALVGALLAAAGPARAGEVKVSFSNGLVTIIATDASPREILGEWARLGQVRVMNLDRLAGGPVTLQLANVSETQALETVLRGTAGYVAAPRRESVATISRYDRILLMPGLAPAMPAAGAPSRSPATSGAGRGRPGQSPYGMPADNETGPMSGPTQAWTNRGAGRPGPNRPAMSGQGMQSFVAAEPYLNGAAQEQPAAGSTAWSGRAVGQPAPAATGSATRPGELPAPAAGPYGLPNPGTRPVVKPPAKAPAGPIKVPD